MILSVTQFRRAYIFNGLYNIDARLLTLSDITFQWDNRDSCNIRRDMMIGEKIIYVTKINKLNHLREMLHIWAILYVKNECICDWYTIRSVWKVCFCLRWNLYLNDSFLSMQFLIKISQYRVIWFIFIICIIFKLISIISIILMDT